MDIHVSPGIAETGVDAIWPEDISLGPVCRAPDVIIKILRDWPKGMEDDLIRFALHTPFAHQILNEAEVTGDRTGAVTVVGHRVTIIGGGKLLGYGFRVNDMNLRALRFWEKLCRDHLKRGKRV